MVDDDKRRAIHARRAEGQSLREISRGVSLAVVDGEVQAAELATEQDRPMPDVSKSELLPSHRPTTAQPHG